MKLAPTTTLLLAALTASATAVPMVGADRDKHGCVASAGYTWSVLRASCIRVFELGVRLIPVAAPKSAATLSAFVVESLGNDDSKVEVFLPGRKGSVLLGKQGADAWVGAGLRLTRQSRQFQLGPPNGPARYQGGPMY